MVHWIHFASYIVLLAMLSILDLQENIYIQVLKIYYMLAGEAGQYVVGFLDSPNKGGTTGVGFLLSLYRITFACQDFPSPATCLDLPRLA